MEEALGVLRGWGDDFGSESINGYVWAARDKLAEALKELPAPRTAVASEATEETT